ncbi:MAG: PAS domain-containing protein [Candidatus Margulisiibacteriota bacterium]|nr:PAS domain-containing protein [Candidatus Margulisiibacteriota bacterium]
MVEIPDEEYRSQRERLKELENMVVEYGKLEKQLRRSEEKYLNLIDNAGDPIVIFDRKGKILQINKQLSVASGYSKEELEGENLAFLGIFDIKNKAIVLKNFFDRMRGKFVPPYEVRLKRKSGEPVQTEINAAPIYEDGKIVGDMAILRDLTERKKMEDEVKVSEEKFRAVFESVQEAIYLVDREGRLLDCNKYVEELIGYKVEELKGMSFKDMTHLLSTDQILKIAEIIPKITIRGSYGPEELEVIRKDGKRINIEIKAKGVKIGDKKIHVGIAREVLKG